MWQLHALLARDLIAERRREADSHRVWAEARRRADRQRAAESTTRSMKPSTVPARQA